MDDPIEQARQQAVEEMRAATFAHLDGRPAAEHHCGNTCVCPTHGSPLLWSRHHDLHACQDSTCRYAHGLESHPDYEAIELMQREDRRRHLFEGHLFNPEETDRG